VREIMTERSSWTGSAADLLRAGADRSGGGISRDSTGWPKNPRALAGRLRRAQTFLRVLGIDITFSRAPRAGSRIIRMHALSNIPSAPSAPSATLGPASGHPPPPSPPDICEDNRRPDLVGFWPVAQVPIATTDDADGADANAALRGGTAADCGRDLCERPPEAMPGSSG